MDCARTFSTSLCIAIMLFGCSRKKEGGDAPILKSRIVPGTMRIDLSDDWTPYMFSQEACDASIHPASTGFGPTFRALTNEQPVVSPLQKAAYAAFLRRLSAKRRREFQDKPIGSEIFRYLEVYGIPPTLSVLRKRAETELYRACWNEISYDKINAFSGFVAYSNNADARARAADGKRFSHQLKLEMSERGFANLTAYLGRTGDAEVKRRIEAAMEYEALAEAQRLLRCEGLLVDKDEAAVEGGLDYPTHLALFAFEQKNRIVGWGYFGGETLAALGRLPEDRLYETLLRVVTERVIDGTGIIEDGSATEQGVPATYKDASGKTRAVPNLIAETTQAVLEKLGIHEKVRGISFLKNAGPEGFRDYHVSVSLPTLPVYYGSRMSLALEIDRGDVYYDYPYNNGKRAHQPKDNAPSLRVYVYHDGQKIQLARMAVSVGGWQDETADDGYVYLKYKNSEPGAGVVREILAAPTWIPPETTPPEEILTTAMAAGREVIVPDQNLVGPWFTSAYGLAAGIYLRSAGGQNAGGDYEDTGIRIHGSYDYTSVARRSTHGCHRLYNYAALRLYDFVLRRSAFQCLGETSVREVRRFEHEGTPYKIEVNTEGRVYLLDKPIPVETLEGRILGTRKTPVPYFMPKPGIYYGPDAVYVKR